jgi:hypothetical protein
MVLTAVCVIMKTKTIRSPVESVMMRMLMWVARMRFTVNVKVVMKRKRLVLCSVLSVM